MLVLTRKGNQRIIIGNDVIVEILELKGKQVRVGITAPKTIPVHREEVFLRVKNAALEEKKEQTE